MLITTAQLLERYQISRTTFYKWQQKRNFPAAFSPGRWAIESVTEWEQAEIEKQNANTPKSKAS